MKTLDTISKRILIVAFSVSLVLLSMSAFLLTIQRVTAEPKQQFNMVMPARIGLGVDTKEHVGYVGIVNYDGSINTIKIGIPY